MYSNTVRLNILKVYSESIPKEQKHKKNSPKPPPPPLPPKKKPKKERNKKANQKILTYPFLKMMVTA